MEAFVTLATTDEYAIGALVLAHSLKRVQTSKQLACMISKSVNKDVQEALRNTFDHVEVVDVLDSNDEVNLALLSRPDLGVTFTKIHCWRLTKYTKAVFMDADTLVIKNIDDLFEREEFSAAPDPGWPDCFNSGVFVYKPSVDTYKNILNMALTQGSFDGGDQGLLNSYFSNWSTSDASKRLPFTYNCSNVAFYTYMPAMKNYRDKIHVAHFIGQVKPWHMNFDLQTSSVVSAEHNNSTHATELLNYWWSLFWNCVRTSIKVDVPGHAGELLRKPLTGLVDLPKEFRFSSAPQQKTPTSQERQLAWERGEIDYTGSDRFENIESKLNSVIQPKKN